MGFVCPVKSNRKQPFKTKNDETLKTIILVVFTVYFTSCTKEALEETPETTSFQYSWKAEGEDEDLPIPIFGSVQNVQSTPVPEASVQLLQSGEVIYQAYSDAQGAYTLDTVSPGTYEFRITAAGYQELTESLEISDPMQRLDLLSSL